MFDFKVVPSGGVPPTGSPQGSGGSVGCPGVDGVPMGCRWDTDEAFPRGGAGPYSVVPSMCHDDIEHQ